MRTSVFAFVCATLAQTFGVSTAYALTEDQKNTAVQNLAVISVAKRWCTGYQFDEASTVAAAMTLVDITVEPYATRFLTERRDAEKMAGDLGTSTFCATAYKIYGPQGVGVMMRR